MARTEKEVELGESFAAEYVRAQDPVMLDIERSVCGCDYGGTSWTTREEADRMSELLDLRRDTAYLELGSGSGWPGLYLAGTSGCDATLADLPLEAIRIAARRAVADELPGRVTLAVADGASLPFDRGRFDAIGHSDVLCCLAPKERVLRECHRVVHADGRMVFSVIYVAPGLSGADHARAVDAGPPFIDADREYPELLAGTGWEVIDRYDLSAAYEDTGRRHLREVEDRETALREFWGDAGYEETIDKRNRNLAAVAEGIVRRDLYAVRPSPGP